MVSVCHFSLHWISCGAGDHSEISGPAQVWPPTQPTSSRRRRLETGRTDYCCADFLPVCGGGSQHPLLWSGVGTALKLTRGYSKRVVKAAQMTYSRLEDISKCRSRAVTIMKDPTHLTRHVSNLLPSGIRLEASEQGQQE